MHKPDKAFIADTAKCALFIWGIFLMLLSFTHIAIAAASLAVNAVNIAVRRSCASVLPLIFTFPVTILSLINSVLYNDLLPLWLFLASVPAAALLALAIQLYLSAKRRK